MLSYNDCKKIAEAIISLLKSVLISTETKEEILEALLYKDFFYPIETWFEVYSSFPFSSLKLNCESIFRIAVERGLMKALICFKLVNIPYIPGSADEESSKLIRYNLEVVKWLFDHRYLTKSLSSPEPDVILRRFSYSAKHHNDTDILNFLKEKELFVHIDQPA